METKITMDRSLVAVETNSTVHVMVELTAPQALASGRVAIDAVVVLDRSGSMSGAPMHAVREATCNLLRLLGSNDRLGVVAFDDDVELAVPLAVHDITAASARVRQIETAGCTNLSGGWLKSFEMLTADGRSDALRRIIVLTDGHANAGITDKAALCAIASGAKAQGITTTTVGFDTGYDEVLLAAIADAGGGNDYWCAGPDQAPQVFTAEFEGLSSVVAQNISVEIRPAIGISVEVLNEYPITSGSTGLQVTLGDAYGGEKRRLVVTFTIPAPHAVRAVSLGDVIIRWASTVADVALHDVVIPLIVHSSKEPDAAPLDPDVTEQVNVLRAIRSRQQAHTDLLRGDTGAARIAMTAAVTLLAAAPCQAEALGQAQADLAELDSGQWGVASTKRLHSDVRGAQKGRRSRFDGDGDDLSDDT
ncbi:MAG: VWA domain-containing protein [Ilumatobacteraceae bacterium]